MTSLLKTSFILLANRSNSRGMAPVFCRLSIGKLRKTFATGIFIPPRQWSKLSQRVLGTTPEEKLINNRLSDLEAQFARIEKQLYNEGKTILLEIICACFLGSEEEITSAGFTTKNRLKWSFSQASSTPRPPSRNFGRSTVISKPISQNDRGDRTYPSNSWITALSSVSRSIS